MKYITEGFNHAIERTTIEPAIGSQLLAAWGKAHQSGEPRAERRTLSILKNSEWTWPWFDEWLVHFQSAKRWPHVWWEEKIPYALAEGDMDAIEDAAISVLSHTLAMTVYCCRNAAKGHGKFLERRGWDFRSAGCPVEDAIAAENIAAVDLANWHTWPPYFPGDRSSLLARRLAL